MPSYELPKKIGTTKLVQVADHGATTVGAAVRRAMYLTIPSAIAVLGAGYAMANPEDGRVVRGQAVIEDGGAGTLNITQSSERSVINWRSFSIGQNETVNFFQPSSTASTLNRVTGGQRSVIEGILNANGRVFLVNSSGMLFARSAAVNVGSLVATTANVSDDSFMADRLQFHEAGAPGADITNLGTITVRGGGLAALVAPTVRNAGLIRADMGSVVLGASEVFTLDFYGDRMINFAVGERTSNGTAFEVDNSGALVANGGQVMLTAQAASDMVGGVINMSGVIQARTVSRDATGRIVLDAVGGDVTVSGSIEANGAGAGLTGGHVEILGDFLRLTESALVDVSGAGGGGTAWIGGPPGAVASDQRAAHVTIESGAVIDASAHSRGDGGTVSIWGTQEAYFEGTIRNRGGEFGGDGGFVEVSSPGVLRFLGLVDTTAPRGSAGVVLLDPEEIAVEQVGSASTSASVIDGDSLSQMLRSGNNVVLAADDSITINYIIDGRPVAGGTGASGTVSMTAGVIEINAPVITNNASINLEANSGDIIITGQGRLYVANGVGEVGSEAIELNAAGSIQSDGHIISLGTIELRATLDVELRTPLAGLANGSSSSGIGRLIIVAEQGSVALAGASVNDSVNVTASDGVSLSGSSLIADSDVTIDGGSGSITLSGGINAAIDSDGNVDLLTTGGVDLGGGISTSRGSGDITIGQSTGVRVSGVIADDDVVLESGGDISVFTGSVGVQLGQLVAGATSGVRVDSLGDVWLGPVSGSATAGSATSTGWLDVRGANIETNGILTSGISPAEIGGLGVRLEVGAGGRVDILGPILAEGGPVAVGLANAAADPLLNAQVNLSHNIVTAGQNVTINGDITLFRGRFNPETGEYEGIDRYDLFGETPNAELLELFVEADRGLGGEAIAYADQEFSHNPAALCEGAGCRSEADQTVPGEWDGFNHDPLDNDPSTDEIEPHVNWLAEMMRFVAATFTAEDGEQLCIAGMGCREELGEYSMSDTRSTEALLADAQFREALLQSLLGTLVARIDTGNVSGRVTVNGSIGRYVPATLAAPNRPSDEGSPQVVHGSMLNTELEIRARESVVINASYLGDVNDEIWNRTGITSDNYDGTTGVLHTAVTDDQDHPELSEGLPVLGTFGIRVISPTVDISAEEVRLGSPSSSLLEFVCGDGCQPVQLAFRVPWTDDGPGSRPINNPSTPSPDVGPPIPIGGLPGSGAGDVGAPQEGAIGFPINSVAEDDQRSDVEGSTEQGGEANDEESDQCRRGASKLADLGQYPGDSGADLNTFARCQSDF